MKSAVIVFPGSNCDRDVKVALEKVTGGTASMVWHGDAVVPATDLIVLPGGFAYGDYLRTGAMAAHSPIMRDVVAKAKAGTPVLGICNGFQVLLEAGLLPGAMLRNRELKFRCEHVHLRVECTDTPFTMQARVGQVLRIPIAHGEGNYYASPETLAQLEANRQVVVRYASPDGRIGDQWNPNGSVHGIAGLCSDRRNVVGMMPHPERACEPLLGSVDGRVILESAVAAVAAGLGADSGVPFRSSGREAGRARESLRP